MTKLSDTQLVILTAAAQRGDRLVLPLPDHLRGGAATKVVNSLTAKGLIEEVKTKRGEPIWRETGDGHDVTLIATDAAFSALGIDDGASNMTQAIADAGVGAPPRQPPLDREGDATPPKGRENTKQAMLIAMLEALDGATVQQISQFTGWQPHTVRGAISGALKKKLGLKVISAKVEGRGRVYCIEQ